MAGPLLQGDVFEFDRVDSRFALSQWETPLLCNDVSHWLGANLESALSANPLSSSVNSDPGDSFTIKILSYLYRNSHYKEKTYFWKSLYQERCFYILHQGPICHFVCIFIYLSLAFIKIGSDNGLFCDCLQTISRTDADLLHAVKIEQITLMEFQMKWLMVWS